jgi:hypothetical protein
MTQQKRETTIVFENDRDIVTSLNEKNTITTVSTY